METSERTDLRLGYTIILAVLIVAGGIAMIIQPGEYLGAIGFALAILAGLTLVVTLHLME